MWLLIETGDVLQCLQITDTSAGHDGEVEMEHGAELRFDDAAASGFVAEASAVTLTATGTIDDPAVITSENRVPRHPWRLPAKTAVLAAEHLRMEDSFGFISATWGVNKVEIVDRRTMPAGALELMREVVLLEAWDGSLAADGKRTYSAAAATKARIARKPTMIIDSQGREMQSSVQVYVDGDVEVEVTSRVTLPGGNQPIILAVREMIGPGGTAYAKVIYT